MRFRRGVKISDEFKGRVKFMGNPYLIDVEDSVVLNDPMENYLKKMMLQVNDVQ